MTSEFSHARTPWQLAFSRDFAPFFWARLISSAGIFTHLIVGAILAYTATQNASAVALVTVLQFGPQILLASWSGGLVDRGIPMRQIFYGQVLGAAASGSLAAWLLVKNPSGGVATMVPLALSSLVIGVAFAVSGPAMQSVAGELVNTGEIPAAVGLNSLPMVFGRAVGPVLGGTVVAIWGASAAFAIAAAAQLLLAVVISPRIKTRKTAPSLGKGDPVAGSLQYVRHNPNVLRMLIAITAVGVGTEPLITLAVPLARQVGLSDTAATWFATAFGIGSVIGLFVYFGTYRRVSLTVITCCSLTLMGLGLVVVAINSSAQLTVIGNAFCGAGMMAATCAVTSQLQLGVPSYMVGRIMGLYMIGFVGSRPLAALLAGGLADLHTTTSALMACAGMVIGAAVVCRPRN